MARKEGTTLSEQSGGPKEGNWEGEEGGGCIHRPAIFIMYIIYIFADIVQCYRVLII